jgi:anti-sigma regulatory factor (Ser/Thr protein kinase)
MVARSRVVAPGSSRRTSDVARRGAAYGVRVTAAPVVDDFSHEAFFYADLGEFLDQACGFVRDGLERDEAVLVATGGERLAALRQLFGSEPDVGLADMAEVGVNPARIIPLWREFLDDNAAAGRVVRGIGEPIWAGRSDAELAECHQHEALLNVAFADGPGWRLLCPYDVTALPADVVQEARGTHPVLLEGGRFVSSDVYHLEAARRALRHWPLPPPPEAAPSVIFGAGDLADVRRQVLALCHAEGLGADRADDLVLCADELAANSLLHGGGSGELRLWRDDDAVVCEVRDAGTIDDPLAGRRVPSLDRVGGRGLWLANQLCDLVQLRSGAAGTVIRLHMCLGSSQPAAPA